MARKKHEEKDSQEQNKTPQEEKKEPFIYTGEPIANERFFIRPGQIFMEIPAYIKDEEIRKKFIPVSKANKQ